MNQVVPINSGGICCQHSKDAKKPPLSHHQSLPQRDTQLFLEVPKQFHERYKSLFLGTEYLWSEKNFDVKKFNHIMRDFPMRRKSVLVYFWISLNGRAQVRALKNFYNFFFAIFRTKFFFLRTYSSRFWMNPKNEERGHILRGLAQGDALQRPAFILKVFQGQVLRGLVPIFGFIRFSSSLQ